MPYILEDLEIDRVDLVDEGANSAAFIEIFKRKENTMEFSEIISKMKPEHASVVQQQIDTLTAECTSAKEELEKAKGTIAEQETKLTEASMALDEVTKERDALKVAKECGECECDGEADENGLCKACGKPKKKSASFDEANVLKSMPEAIRETFLKMREQKEAAEALVRKANEEKAESEAVAKAATLKALPVDQATLVNVLKNCDQTVFDILTTVANAIDSTVLEEVGKSNQGATAAGSAWDKIEAEATNIAKRDSITKQKAIAVVIKEKPELYREYLNGGAQ